MIDSLLLSNSLKNSNSDTVTLIFSWTQISGSIPTTFTNVFEMLYKRS